MYSIILFCMPIFICLGKSLVCISNNFLPNIDYDIYFTFLRIKFKDAGHCIVLSVVISYISLSLFRLVYRTSLMQVKNMSFYNLSQTSWRHLKNTVSDDKSGECCSVVRILLIRIRGCVGQRGS